MSESRLLDLLVLHKDSAVPVRDGVVVLEEARSYQIRLAQVRAARARTARAWLGVRPLSRSASGDFVIDSDHAVGQSHLRVELDDHSRVWPVEIHPRAEKLSDTSWLTMLTDLEAWLPSATVGRRGPRHGQVGERGASAPFLAEALAPLIPALERLIRLVLADPRIRSLSRWRDVPIHQARSVDRETLAWVSRHPDVGLWLDPWRAADLSGPAPLLPQRHTIDTVDHPANRYLSWLIVRVVTTLRQVADALHALGGDTDHGPWCSARAARLRADADRLDRLWRASFLRTLPRQPASEAALLVVLDDPLYARIHRICRRFLSPKFQLANSDGQPMAAVRPSFTLYELWCFLAVVRQLKDLLPGWRFTDRGLGKLRNPSGTGAGASVTGRGPAGTLTVHFNPTFRGYLARGQQARYTLSGERRPDITVTWQPAPSAADSPSSGRPAWLCLDAKYRVGKRNLADAFTSVHIYRDSLRDDDFGGPCTTAVLLAPASSEEVAPWFSEEFRAEFGTGIFQLTPGVTAKLEVGKFVLKSLIDQVAG